MEPRDIYELLRERIIRLELKPERILNLSELAESHGVSRTPVKEALVQLQAEGWVLRHGSHFMVTPLSLDRIREITEIRLVLEAQANVWAMERIDPADLDELAGIVEKVRSGGDGMETREIVDFDFSFHRRLFKASKNLQLNGLLERLLGHYLRFWLAGRRPIDPAEFAEDHHRMIGAMRAKDETELRRFTTEHIRKSVEEIMGAF